jgi:hypothetical protein
MFERFASRKRKIENPSAAFDAPRDVIKDADLSVDDVKAALDTWEQDARQLMTASNEGMPGPTEGRKAKDHHRLGEVVRAKDKIGEKPVLKPAH